MNNQERVARLETMIANGNVIRGQWTDGQERACLLGALSPEAGNHKGAFACPASVMPQWLAHLTPSMDDNGTLAAWPGMVKRYAAVAARWHVLSPETWRRLDHAARALIVREARMHTADPRVLAAIDEVANLLSKASSGEPVSDVDWSAAVAVAVAAGRAAAVAVAVAAGRAAARAAARAAESAAAWSAAAAAAAARSARSAESAESAWSAAAAESAWSAAAAAWDRMTDGILGLIEVACTEAEAGR